MELIPGDLGPIWTSGKGGGLGSRGEVGEAIGAGEVVMLDPVSSSACHHTSLSNTAGGGGAEEAFRDLLLPEARVVA